MMLAMLVFSVISTTIVGIMIYKSLRAWCRRRAQKKKERLAAVERSLDSQLPNNSSSRQESSNKEVKVYPSDWQDIKDGVNLGVAVSAAATETTTNVASWRDRITLEIAPHFPSLNLSKSSTFDFTVPNLSSSRVQLRESISDGQAETPVPDEKDSFHQKAQTKMSRPKITLERLLKELDDQSSPLRDSTR